MIDVATLMLSLLTIVGVLVSGGLWLRNETREIARDANDRLLHGEDFEARVAKIVGAAMTGFVAPMMTAIADVEGRQRDQGKRLGELEKKLAAVEGRLHGSRTGDPP